MSDDEQFGSTVEERMEHLADSLMRRAIEITHPSRPTTSPVQSLRLKGRAEAYRESARQIREVLNLAARGDGSNDGEQARGDIPRRG